MSILIIEIKGEMGSLCALSVHAILPSLGSKTTCEVYTDVFPNGITVDGSAQEVSGMWWQAMGEWMVEADDDDTSGRL